jgi:hypothetical protein
VTLVLFLPTAGVPFVYTSADHPALPPALDGLNKQFESKPMRLVQLLVVLLQTVRPSTAPRAVCCGDPIGRWPYHGGSRRRRAL